MKIKRLAAGTVIAVILILVIINISSNTLANADDNGVYTIYTSGGLAHSSSNSLYDAIDISISVGKGSYVIVKGHKTPIFLLNNDENTFYCYKGTQLYSITKEFEDALNFTNTEDNAHVINGKGQNVSNSYKMLRGQPDSWSLEPQGGGYFYKFAYVYNSYRKVTVRVNLTELRLKPSQTNQKHNAYAYLSSQNSTITLDAGLYSGWAHNGEWRVFVGHNGFQDLGVITQAEYVDGEYIPNTDVLLTYEYFDGKMVITAEALNTGKIIKEEFLDDRIGGNMALLSGTSYVSDIKPEQPIDIRSGGYLKNVEYRDFLIYDIGGNSYEFWSDSDSVNYSLLYNDECISFESYGSGKTRTERVSISYDIMADIGQDLGLIDINTTESDTDKGDTLSETEGETESSEVSADSESYFDESTESTKGVAFYVIGGVFISLLLALLFIRRR